jgi:hypothetical protein
MAQAVSRRPLTAAAWVRAQVNPVGFVVDKVAVGQVFIRVLRFYPVNIIPPRVPVLIERCINCQIYVASNGLEQDKCVMK